MITVNKSVHVIAYFSGLMPFRVPLTSVVGDPIQVPQVDNPSQELIEEYHKKYIQSLEKLHSHYGKNKQLNIQ
jgi:hypothetical protein